ncbi:MAG: hypothetical protein ABSB84_12535, partial [Verrucomicrobiota bacterium]
MENLIVPPNELSHAGVAMSTAKRKLKAPTGGGSSDWLGVMLDLARLSAHPPTEQKQEGGNWRQHTQSRHHSPIDKECL